MVNTPFSKIDEIGILVKDAEKAARFYETLGLGPFVRRQHNEVKSKKLDGEQAEAVSEGVQLKLYQAEMESVNYLLVEPLGGGTLWQELLDANGEGVFYLGSAVDDIDAESAKLEAKGFKTCYESRFEGGGGAAHFVTDEVGGVPHFALIQWPDA